MGITISPLSPMALHVSHQWEEEEGEESGSCRKGKSKERERERPPLREALPSLRLWTRDGRRGVAGVRDSTIGSSKSSLAGPSRQDERHNHHTFEEGDFKGVFFRIPCQVSGRERERANDRERNPLGLFGRVGGGRNPLLQVMFFSYISFPFSLFGIGRCLLRSSPPFFGLPRLSEEKYQIPVTQAKKGKRRGNECLRREGG